MAVGFGIATPEQAGRVAQFADGVIIGSALVRKIAELHQETSLILNIKETAQSLKTALSHPG